MNQNIHYKTLQYPRGTRAHPHKQTHARTHLPQSRALSLSLFSFLICVDSKSVLCALQNWDCKMRRDIVYEVKYLIHYIMSRGTGIEFCWVPSHCGLYWNEISDKLAKYMSEISYNDLRISYHEIASILEKTVYQNFKKINLRYLLVQGI